MSVPTMVSTHAYFSDCTALCCSKATQQHCLVRYLGGDVFPVTTERTQSWADGCRRVHGRMSERISVNVERRRVI
eukprot:6292087-Pyramimonas_sp.AAC.1